MLSRLAQRGACAFLYSRACKSTILTENRENVIISHKLKESRLCVVEKNGVPGAARPTKV